MSTTMETIKMRSPSEVMKLNRIGVFRQTSLSFLRTLIRRMYREKWDIDKQTFSLDEKGYGHAIYIIETPEHTFSFVVVSSKIDDRIRSDRVIATEWDVTFSLHEGVVTDGQLQNLLKELPKQEAGRAGAKDLVWSRANKSTRVFNYIVDCLAEGKQPDPTIINKVGYLLRTTAVYGNGKFGLAPYDKIKNNHPLSGPFIAQMLAVYILRHFSFELVEHIAACKSEQAVKLNPEIKRIIGTGNATGLGMAPYLLSHPRLLHQWVYIREKAIARVKAIKPSEQELELAMKWAQRISVYLEENKFVGKEYFEDNGELAKRLLIVKDWIYEYIQNQTMDGLPVKNVWDTLATLAKQKISFELEEIVYTILMEIYLEDIIDLENNLNVDEVYEVDANMTIQELQEVIKRQYDWVFQYDFNKPEEKYYFWYRSEEKEEPRLGIRNKDIGEEWELPLNIAEKVQQLDRTLSQIDQHQTVAAFILLNPRYKGIVQRIQSLIGYEYGEIQENLTSKDLYPLHLLRCKLSFFGAERFDPKSDKWVRITLFQGAPLVEELDQPYTEDWVFPSLETSLEEVHNNER